MTLQYHFRSKYQDELWRHRVYLCERLMFEAVNRWYLSGGEFPTQPVAAGVLYLFSPRCEAFELSPYHLVERLGKIVGTPEEEYRQAWPHHSEAEAQAFIASLSDLIKSAVLSWTDGREEPSSGGLADCLVGEVVAQQYVVFHHYKTTKRDVNPWGI